MRQFTILLLALFAAHGAFASTARYIDGQYITNGAYTLTVPAATDTLVGKATSDVLLNKTIDGSSNTITKIPVGAIGNGSVLSGSNTGDMSLGVSANGLSLLGQVLSLDTASSGTTGALTSGDWSTFNGKQAALGYTPVSDAFLLNGHALGGTTLSLAASDLNLGNVTNDAQVKKSEYTAKGDILVGTNAGTYAALGTSTNGYILTLDSTGGGGAVGVKWAAAPSSAPNIVGSTGSPTAITAGGGVAFTGTYYENINFIVGDGGAVDITANPQIAAATNVGQRLTLIGTHDTNTVKLEDGTGLSLNGAWFAADHSVIVLVWDGALWVEQSRR